MNEKIRELAEQAGLLGPSSRVGNAHEATEKFAELLEKEFEAKHFSAGYIAGRSDGTIETVKECAEQIIAKGTDWVDFAPSQTGVRPEYWDMAQQIKQHFGVEE